MKTRSDINFLPLRLGAVAGAVLVLAGSGALDAAEVIVDTDQTINGGHYNFNADDALVIGRWSEDTPPVPNTVTVTGGATTDPMASVVVGRTWPPAYGRLVIEQGSTVTVSGNAVPQTIGTVYTVYSGDSHIGLGNGSGGSVLVTGAGSTWNSRGALVVGDAGTGVLEVANGGKVINGRYFDEQDNIYRRTAAAYIGSQAAGIGTVEISGADSAWELSDLYIGNAGTGSLTISDGARVGTTSTWYSTIGVHAGSNGSVTVSGAGSEWYTGILAIGQNGTGRLAINDGGVVTADPSTMVIGAAGTLAGDGGTLVGNVQNNGTIAPGNSTGTLTIDGNLNNASGSIVFEIAGASDYDTLNITGAFSGGGSFVVALLNGFVPSAGDRFELVNFAAAGYAFNFDSAALPGHLSWDISDFDTTGAISVVPEPGAVSLLVIAAVSMLRRRRGR